MFHIDSPDLHILVLSSHTRHLPSRPPHDPFSGLLNSNPIDIANVATVITIIDNIISIIPINISSTKK